MVKGTNRLNLQLGGFKSSILDSCKTPKVSITGKLQIVPAPVDKLFFQPNSGIPFLVFFYIYLMLAKFSWQATMEIETRILNDRAEEDEEKEEASRWTGLPV